MHLRFEADNAALGPQADGLAGHPAVYSKFEQRARREKRVALS